MYIPQKCFSYFLTLSLRKIFIKIINACAQAVFIWALFYAKFAKVAFDIDLKEFIDRFGNQKLDLSFSKKTTKPNQIYEINAIDTIWKKLVQRDLYRKDLAESWLSKARGFLKKKYKTPFLEACLI